MSIKDEGIVTQLAVVATMMPKVKQYIDELIAENEALKGQYKFGVDWSKDGSAVSVVRINKDGVAEVVFHHFNPSFVK